jgi:5'-nucleotidase
VQRFGRHPFGQAVLLNVNVPDISYENIKAMEVTRLGKRHKAEPVVKSKTPRGDIVYWIGAAGGAQDAGEGTDFHAVAHHAVSVTPLQMDLTRYSQLDVVRKWLQ